MGPYRPEWESLAAHSIPQWFRDATFGIYFHWGPYAVPAYANEWYSRNMYVEGTDAYEHHEKEWGPRDEFGYKDFIPMFEAEEFDASAWADFCKDVGAEFVGITATHADGFLMWDSDVSEWNAAEMGPKRDVVGELAEAVRERDMKFVTSFHHDFHWWWYPHVDGWDTADPEYAGLYGEAHDKDEDPPESFFEDWQAKVMEVIDAYRPDLIYFDSGIGNDWFINHFDEYRRELVAYYYNRAEEWGKEVDFTHKQEVPLGVGIVDHERTREEDVSMQPWLTDTPLDRNSWGYVENSDYRSVDTVVTGLVDRVSKNGATMVNVGPKADGTLPKQATSRLEKIGDWLERNGEAVYGANPWWTFGEGPTDISSTEFDEASTVEYTSEDIRFTRTDEAAYALLLKWPEDSEVTIETPFGRWTSSVAGEWPIGPAPDPWPEDRYEVELVGADESLTWGGGEDGVRIELPENPPCEFAYAIRIKPSNN
ncbi:alpha-L-fucosidase [Halobacteria archaeon AArc-m2/3/4]|uniref:alpha-L-fucosidase n=1 Tax=Natronoglomus mannanivorans TaxID=2979990 RepID=A0ABT2QKJ4_9EURY|nr:alpha-L-fucosidase [Halobacteria archaeon AArc-m2/3/4]